MQYIFGHYHLDLTQYTLHHAGVPITVRPKVFQLLAYLAAHNDRIVPKAELCTHLWPDHTVSPATLDSCLKEARQAVGDTGRTQRVIATQHGLGYRFLAPLERHHTPIAAPTPQALIPPPLAAVYSPSPAGLLGAYKTVTVVVCQLPAAALDPTRHAAETWHHQRQTVLALAQETVAPYDGTVQDLPDGGVLVLFGAPVAQEDHAERAVRAALELSQHLQYVGAVQCGLHTGPLLLGTRSATTPFPYTAVGDTITLAAQLAALAPPGRIVLSAATHRQVAAYVETRAFTMAEAHEPDTVPRAWEVVRVLANRTRVAVAVADGRLTPYVGRADDLALLHTRFHQASTGHGQVVSLVGEAGMGKSRLLFELRQQLSTAGVQMTWLEGRCLSFGQAMPLLPVRAHLQALFALTDADDTPTIRTKVDAGLHRLGGLEAHRSALQYLLAMDPEEPSLATIEPAARRQRVFDALLALALRCAQHQPLLLIFEDLQWSDRSTEAFLHRLLDAVAGVPLCVLLTYRVGYTPAWGSRSFHTTLTLQPLTAGDILVMAQHLLGRATMPAALQDLLLEQTAGIPLFVEEAVKTLHDLDAVRPAHDAPPLALPPAAFQIPATLHGLLTARLDRLSAASQHVVHLASVLGRAFSGDLLAALVGDQTPLTDALAELQAREILCQRGLVPEPVYAFTHALLQEVAYDNLLLQQRQVIHATVGHIMAHRAATRLEACAAELAHHFLRGEVWAHALTYSTMAGDQSAEAYANTEAQAHYAQALHAATQLSPAPDARTIAQLQSKHAAVLVVLADYDAAIAAYQQALTCYRQAQDRHGVIEVFLGLSTVYTNAPHFGVTPALDALAQAVAEARALDDPAVQAECLARQVRLRTRGFGALREATPDAQEALQLAQGTGDPRLLAETSIALGRVLQWRGMVAQSLTYLHAGATYAQHASAGFLFGMATFFLGIAQAAQGAYEEALQSYAQLHTYATQAEDRYWIARVPNARGGLYLELGAYPMARESVDEADALAQQFGHWGEVRGHALVQRGLLALLQEEDGQAEAAFAQATAVLETEIWMRWRWHIVLLWGQGALALAQGRHDEAWAYATQSLALATTTDARKHMARAHRLQGDILAARGQFDQAVKAVQTSVAVATQLQLPLEQWRGHAALGKILAAQGREPEAARAYTQAHHLIEAMAAALDNVSYRQTFLNTASIREVYAAVGQHPPGAFP